MGCGTRGREALQARSARQCKQQMRLLEHLPHARTLLAPDTGPLIYSIDDLGRGPTAAS